MAKKQAAAEQPKAEEVIVAYKGFGADWKCRDFQYEVGKTYEHKGRVRACEGGFHACEDPGHVLSYYRPNTSRYAVVRQWGDLARHEEDSKVASRHIAVEAEISLMDLIKACVKYRFDRCTPAEGGVSDKPQTVVKAEGRNQSATASGYYGAATASGDSGAATASGYSGAATASGYSGAATASGYSGAATASGDSGAATASGYSGAATASGYYGAATASGYYGAATASGYSGAATASGNYGAATASGYYGAATASGRRGKARGKDGCALFLTERDSDWKIVAAWAGIVGQDGIKADTWYRLVDGKPTEV